MTAFVARLCILAASIVRNSAAADDGLGPGVREWVTADPAKYGLSQQELAAAAQLVGKLVPERGCLLITKGGEIIAEEYYGYSPDTRWESDSMGKTFAAALFGVAVEMGIVDLDKPLADYGMPRFANWNHTGVDFWPNVTARHLLTQTSGYGVVAPGTKMTYDSNLYIQHLSYLLSHLRYSAQHFATHFFAKPLGVPDLYVYDSQRWFPDLANEISIGGGQMVTCREAARIGQFVLNRGIWKDSGGSPVRLGNEDYFRQMLSPAYPGVVDGYGFLTWLNTDQSENTSEGKPRSHCCGPRFGGNKKVCNEDRTQCAWCCSAQPGYTNSSVPCDIGISAIDPTYKQANLSGSSMYVSKQIIGDDLAWMPKSPEQLGIGFGQYAKYMLILPEENMQIISMGMSYGKSLNCPDAYNDMTSLAFMWDALAQALHLGTSDVCGTDSSCRQAEADASVGAKVASATGPPPESSAPPPASMQSRTRRLKRNSDIGVKDEFPSTTTSALWELLTGIWSTARSFARFPTFMEASGRGRQHPPPPHPVPKPDDNPVVGSCYCGCPPDLLVGMCFNVKKDKLPSDKDCSKVRMPRVDALPAVCPTVGLVLQCDPAVYRPEEMCSNQTLQGGGMKCHSMTPCRTHPSLPNTWQATCQCVPTEWVDDNGESRCTWSDDPCIFSAYVTP